MKKQFFYTGLALFMIFAPALTLHAQLSEGYEDFQPDNTAQEDYYASLGAYFGMTTEKVFDIHEKGIPDEEIAAALFIVSNCRTTGKTVTAGEVVKMRLSGKSWMAITLKYGLTTDIYYFPVKGYVQAKPFGQAYKQFFNTARKKWKAIRLKDADIVNLVNLRFLSRYYEMDTSDIIAMREKETSYVDINREIRRGKDMDWILERAHHEME